MIRATARTGPRTLSSHDQTGRARLAQPESSGKWGPMMEAAAIRYGQSAMQKCLYFAASCFSILFNFAPSQVVLAQEPEKPAIAPIPRTINLTQEQRFIIKENLKDLHLPKASSNAPETIGDVVPENIELHSLPSEATRKVPQARSHLFFMKDNNAIVLVSPSDRRVADVIR